MPKDWGDQIMALGVGVMATGMGLLLTSLACVAIKAVFFGGIHD